MARSSHRYSNMKLNFLSIIEITARVCGTTPRDILGRRKMGKVATARQISFWFARRGRTYMAMAKMFNRHHATGIHAVKTVNNRLSVGDPETTRVVEEVERELAKT
jgi:chromosomal replication initiation ATPase DnaA